MNERSPLLSAAANAATAAANSSSPHLLSMASSSNHHGHHGRSGHRVTGGGGGYRAIDDLAEDGGGGGDEGRPEGGGSSSSSSSSSLEGGEPAVQLPLGGISARQWVLLGVLLVATLTSSFAICLFPPFFPKIAEEKGCTATVYGFIIGTNCLATFLVTPLVGKHVGKIGLRFALIGGTFIGGVCCLLSGFLEFFTPGWEFVIISIFLRVVHASGNAMVITATFTYTAMEFQKDVGKVFSLSRTAMNIGQLFGPSIGGAMYSAGGFYLPFVVMGGLQVVMSILSIPFVPECRLPDTSKDQRVHKKTISVWKMLLIPSIWISFFTFIVATACNGFLSINLEPKVLRRFELSPFYVGLLFGLKDGVNCIASPFWGVLCDKNRKTSVKPYLVASAVFVAISFLMLGASGVVGLHFTLTIPLVVAALSINGFGIGGLQVAGVIDAIHEAVNAGYPDDPAMHGLIAGLWSSLSGLGRFVSRTGSGVLVDIFGFDTTCAVAVFLVATLASVTTVYMVFYEILLKKSKPVHWDNLMYIEDDVSQQNEIIFTDAHEPSESVIGRTVHVEVPRRSSSSRAASAAARSMPPRSRRDHHNHTSSAPTHVTRWSLY